MRCGHWPAIAVALAFSAGAAPIARPAAGSLVQEHAMPVHDALRDAAAWQAAGSEQVTAVARAASAGNDAGLCLDFDFHGVAGFATVRRALPIELPPYYAFTFRVRGAAPPNTLQFKLTDASGDSVWWWTRPDFTPSRDWTTVTIPADRIAFAWGPASDHVLRRAAALEFTVAAGTGGRGTICFADLALTPRPPPPATPPEPTAAASSALPGSPGANALDGDPKTLWRSDPARGKTQDFTIDFGYRRRFDGIVLRWGDDESASRYDVLLSDDGRDWQRARRVASGTRVAVALFLGAAEARFLRLALHAGPGRGYALAGIDVVDGATANAFVEAIAAKAPCGRFPRAFLGKPSYWALVGIDGGSDSALLSTDGAIEVARGGFSIEPFLLDADGRVTSWADAASQPRLAPGGLPLPEVEWTTRDAALTIDAFGDGTRDDARLIASYTLDNRSANLLHTTLALAIRPFQVNPPSQTLNLVGGVSPIHTIAWNDRTVDVDDRPRIWPLEVPTTAFATSFDAGPAVAHLADRTRPSTRAATDESGLASAVLLYRMDLAPGARRTVSLVAPWNGTVPPEATRTPAAWVEERRASVESGWRSRLGGVRITLPPAAGNLADVVRTAEADILMSRDGPALRPGTRDYARSWIRDGAMMSDTLLRLGADDAARDYLAWYAPRQFDNGKVPCCVDARGADPTPEHDSNGEFIHLVFDVWQYTRDRTLLEAMWPHVVRAVEWLDALRATESGDANPEFRGLLPPSISHEGYSAKPMHSYWDDFWALAGYADAAAIARTLGRADEASRWQRTHDGFRAAIIRSIGAVATARGIGYLPGAADLGDFDATSSTIALSVAGLRDALPEKLVRGTWDRYWDEFTARRDGTRNWDDYTPYEWRNVGALVRLGERERADAVGEWLMAGRRPPAWNQWPEVVTRDTRKARFIGDLPHAWVAADFISATLDRLAYVDRGTSALVLAAGVPPAWLDDGGLSVSGLATPYGRLDYTLRRDGHGLRLSIATALAIPPGGLLFRPPGTPADPARVDGRAQAVRDGSIRIDHAPAVVTLTLRGE